MSQPTYFYYPVSAPSITSTFGGSVPAALLTDIQSLKLSRNIDEVAISNLQTSQTATSSAISSEVIRATGIDSTQGTSITNLNTSIAGVGTSIASLTSRVVSDEALIAANTTVISGHSSRLTTDEALITANTSGLSSLTTTVNTMGSNIVVDKNLMSASVNDVVTRMGLAEARITTNTGSIASETNRAMSEDAFAFSVSTQTNAALIEEKNRALAVESGLNARITSNANASAGMANFISTNQIESTTDTLTLGGSVTTTTINLGTSNAAQLINFGTGTSAKTINIGSAADTVVIAGAVVNTTTSNLNIADAQIVLNKGGLAGSAANSGIQFEENGVITGYLTQNSNRDGFSLKPSNSPLISLNQSLSTTDSPTFSSVNATSCIATTISGVTASVSGACKSGSIRVNAGGSSVDTASITASGAATCVSLNTGAIITTGVTSTGDIGVLGNVTANNFNGNLSGNCSGVSLFFTQPLAGDVTGGSSVSGIGTQPTVVERVGGQTSAAVAAAVSTVQAASDVGTSVGTLVLRSSSGVIASNAFAATNTLSSNTLYTNSITAKATDLTIAGGTTASKIILSNPLVATSVSAASVKTTGIISVDTQVERMKEIVLWDSGTATDSTQHNYYGLGMSPATLRYQVADLGGYHRFYAATSATTSNQLVSINPNGTMDVASEVSCGSLKLTSAATSQTCSAGTGPNVVGVPAIAYTMWNVQINGMNFKIPLFAP